MFLVNSRPGLVKLPLVYSWRHPFSRSYGAILPSSLERVVSRPRHPYLPTHLCRFRVQVPFCWRSFELFLGVWHGWLLIGTGKGVSFHKWVRKWVKADFQLSKRILSSSIKEVRERGSKNIESIFRPIPYGISRKGARTLSSTVKPISKTKLTKSRTHRNSSSYSVKQKQLNTAPWA